MPNPQKESLCLLVQKKEKGIQTATESEKGYPKARTPSGN